MLEAAKSQNCCCSMQLNSLAQAAGGERAEDQPGAVEVTTAPAASRRRRAAPARARVPAPAFPAEASADGPEYPGTDDGSQGLSPGSSSFGSLPAQVTQSLASSWMCNKTGALAYTTGSDIRPRNDKCLCAGVGERWGLAASFELAHGVLVKNVRKVCCASESFQNSRQQPVY